jgi:chemotaxis protein CheD
MAIGLATPDQGSTRRFRNPRDESWHVQLMQGDYYVTDDPGEILTTVLGSCIAACIRDPRAGIGGMNHFLLPDGDAGGGNARRFGVNAMEVLINGILKRGGDRSRLEAKLFGGANVIGMMSEIGSRNVEFAKQFLEAEGIAFVGGDVGGKHPRRIQYWPVTGRARQLAVRGATSDLVDRERMAASAQIATPDDTVELF